MKLPVLLAVAISIGVFISPVLAAEDLYDVSGKFAGKYFCIASAAGGVIYSDVEKEWRATSFRVDENKFVINIKKERVVKAGDGFLSGDAMSYAVTISDFVINTPQYCTTRSNYVDGSVMSLSMWKGGAFRCSAALKDYTINLATGRYLAAYLVGYVSGVDNNEDTPSLTIGRCTKIE
ncbi:hypothetical protein C3941_15740 [Kaistia algarum]|uniref:hypothetical protein n=1 Tax=Kaistia algarum TaxID=2083279 RepID=UPI000CE81CAB|nr:hypothetical protein [Kaistia algarum]MCX5514731.1 hypothetical protein [Kaistia algarum]PPE78847.1 hypothetical protein C3941_15740 [Kaistia algarum]